MSLLDNFFNLVPQAKEIMGNFQPNSAEDIKKFLANKGMQGKWIDKAIDKAIPAAKLAKTFGPAKVKSVLQNVDIDNTANQIKELVNPQKNGRVESFRTEAITPQPQYENYDRRNTSSVSHISRASGLPD